MSPVREVSFGANMTKLRKAAIIRKAQREVGFELCPKIDKACQPLTNLAAPLSFVDTGLLVANEQWFAAGGFAIMGTALRHAYINVHKKAIKTAAQTASKLKELNYTVKERRIVTDKILSRNGNPLYTTMFRVAFPKRVVQISDGVETKSGFIHITKPSKKNK